MELSVTCAVGEMNSEVLILACAQLMTEVVEIYKCPTPNPSTTAPRLDVLMQGPFDLEKFGDACRVFAELESRCLHRSSGPAIARKCAYHRQVHASPTHLLAQLPLHDGTTTVIARP